MVVHLVKQLLSPVYPVEVETDAEAEAEAASSSLLYKDL